MRCVSPVLTSFILILASSNLVMGQAAAPAPPDPVKLAQLDLTYPSITGTSRPVRAGDNLQSVLNAAVPGDEVVIDAGATFHGTFTLPAKTGSGWIVIRTAALSALPEGVRVDPSKASSMPKIMLNTNDGTALGTSGAASHYRLVGLEVSIDPGVSGSHNRLIHIGTATETLTTQLTQFIYVDRCYVHGGGASDVRDGVMLDGRYLAVFDSYISNIHMRTDGESHGVGGINADGPYKILNNYIEAAGENIMFGGNDPKVTDVQIVPADIEIKQNLVRKKLCWRQGDPSFGSDPNDPSCGIAWQAKNLFELKNAQRVLVEGNVFENNWPSAQPGGRSLLMTPRNQDGNCTWCVVQDVTFAKNILRHASAGFSIAGTDDGAGQGHWSQQTARISVHDNLVYDIDAQKYGGCCNRALLFLNQHSPNANIPGGVKDLVIDHNTVRIAPGTNSAVVGMGDSTNANDRHQNLTIKNNLLQRGDYGILGNGLSEGTASFAFAVNWSFATTAIIGGIASRYPTESCAPASNCFPATDDDVGFVDWRSDDYRLCTTSIAGCSAASAYKNAGTDGKDIGANVDDVNTATSGALTGVRGGGSGGVSTPWTGTPYSVPGSFEAENFDRGGEGVAYHDNVPGNSPHHYRPDEDVDITLATGNASGYVINNFETGEWLKYTINVTTAASYTIDLNVSSLDSASRFHVEIDGVDVSGSVSVPNTGSWDTFQYVSTGAVNLSSGQHVLKVVADAQYFNFDAVRFSPAASGSTPYPGTPFSVPGTFEAAEFDRGGEGVAYHDQVPGNAGNAGFRTTEDVDIIVPTGNASGYVVNNFETGEWLKYTINVTTAGSYTIDLNASSEYSTSRFHVEIDGVDVSGSVAVPNTGNWSAFQYISTGAVSLNAGQHVLTVVADMQYFNLDAIRFTSTAPRDIVIYASDIPASVRHGAWSTASDPTSPNSVKLVTPDLGAPLVDPPQASPTDYVDVTFTANANVQYTLWLRLQATANSKWNDSMWVQFSDAQSGGTTVYPVNTQSALLVNLATDSNATSLNAWGWQNTAYWLSQSTTFTFPSTGFHTLRIQVREDGVQFDQIVLRQSPAAPGGPTNDTTIVPKP